VSGLQIAVWRPAQPSDVRGQLQARDATVANP
jgi:hypothetical protein